MSKDESVKTLLDFILSEAEKGDTVAVVTHIDEIGRLRKIALNRNGEVQGEIDHLPVDLLNTIVRQSMEGSGSVQVLERLGDYVCANPIVVEIIRPKISLVVFGAGHVGQAVAIMGALLGYDVLVVDDRREFLARARLPDARIRTLESGFDEAVKAIGLTSRSAAVIVTRGHQFDEVCLRSVAKSKAAYIGMIGSKRRVISVTKKLVNEGVPAEQLERVHAPIGLRIGARTPQEIAVAILAEVIRTLSGSEH
jgi:xanthine dehydrogenase accessory factor